MSLTDLLKQSAATEKANKSGDNLFCCILGPSGAGKSHTIGTLGVKTLYLYFAGEAHGVKSASKSGEHITPFCVDYVDGKALSADETLNLIREVINDAKGLQKAGFEALALDGLSELDLCLSQTKELKVQCLTPAGKIDGFRIASVTKQMGNGLVKDLLNLQRETGIHILTTCILEVKEYGEDGGFDECTPRLSTFGFAEAVLQMFPDRVIVCPIQRTNKETSELETVHVFDNRVTVSRSAKNDKGGIKKTSNFSPRVESGAMATVMRADLKKLMEVKTAK